MSWWFKVKWWHKAVVAHNKCLPISNYSAVHLCIHGDAKPTHFHHYCSFLSRTVSCWIILKCYFKYWDWLDKVYLENLSWLLRPSEQFLVIYIKRNVCFKLGYNGLAWCVCVCVWDFLCCVMHLCPGARRHPPYKAAVAVASPFLSRYDPDWIALPVTRSEQWR